LDLFRIMGIMIAYPFLPAVVGALLLVVGRRLRRTTIIGVGVAWLLYAAYETAMYQRWLCSGECNIRVDLLLIYPALLVGLVAARISLFRGRRSVQ
jgi:formate hydrogenlyase subunit 3/multisubunit Na+/H+ antiporter MnhD subunit